MRQPKSAKGQAGRAANPPTDGLGCPRLAMAPNGPPRNQDLEPENAPKAKNAKFGPLRAVVQLPVASRQQSPALAALPRLDAKQGLVVAEATVPNCYSANTLSPLLSQKPP